MSAVKALLLATAMCALPMLAVAVETADADRIAIQLLDRLDAGDYVAAEASFGAPMAAAVPLDKLRAVWQSLPVQAGAARGRGDTTTVMHDGTQVVSVPLHYVRVELVAKVAVAGDGTIVGFLIQPAPPPAAAAPPSDASYQEREVSVVDVHATPARAALSGTLAMPVSAGKTLGSPVAAVVLVHGSGAHDRDETIGPNRPFLDIARGLAAQGIAVLRYDKRSHARPQDFSSGHFDVDDETTDDAVAAVAMLRTLDGIDPQRIFVLGHSQGGMLAPRIAQHSGHVAGLILLAAPARPLLDILIEQHRRLAAMDGDTSAQEHAAIDALVQQVARVRAGGDIPVAQTPMNQPAGYWRSIDAVDAVADAHAIAQPLLVLQGGRDIQVVDADWQRWRMAFGRDPRATFKHYPALNHLGIAGDGPGSLAEYTTPGHVDARLIADVAAWIKLQPATP